MHTVGPWPLGPQSPFWQSCSQGALPLCTHSWNCPSPTPTLCPHQVLVGPLFEPVQVPLVGSLPSTASPAPLSLVPAATLLRVHPTPLCLIDKDTGEHHSQGWRYQLRPRTTASCRVPGGDAQLSPTPPSEAHSCHTEGAVLSALLPHHPSTEHVHRPHGG